MPNIYYQRGVRAERELKEILEKQGYEVFRTAGSHGRADLIAVRSAPSGMHSDELRGMYPARLIQIKTCQEKDIKKYEKEKVPGVELWIKVMGHGWRQID